uniref:Sushi domain-containing protein n=1 Tax=Glossina brevipalpis TaxID=37001 RepID=A0A1A9WKG9_9MUSC
MCQFITLWIIFYIISNVWSACYLQIPRNEEYAPEWEKRVGNRWFKVPHISNRLTLQEGEIVNGYCPTKHRGITYTFEKKTKCSSWDVNCNANPKRKETKYVIDKNITFECAEGLLRYKSKILSEIGITCSSFEWKISLQTMDE